MMKPTLYLTILLLCIYSTSQSQSIFNLEPSQSMLMLGKGKGQDAIINPYPDESSIAVIDNIGENAFSIRIQSKGDIIKIIDIQPNASRRETLLKGYELYLDTEFKTKARVSVEKGTDSIDRQNR